jgi:hypothetical protein
MDSRAPADEQGHCFLLFQMDGWMLSTLEWLPKVMDGCRCPTRGLDWISLDYLIDR